MPIQRQVSDQTHLILYLEMKKYKKAVHAQLLESNGEYAKLWQLQVNEKSDEI